MREGLARRRGGGPRTVNLCRSPSANYARVQDEIAGAVLRHLPAEAVTSTERVYREGAVNFTLFIADHADVILSHGLADKRYFLRRDEVAPRRRLINGFRHVLVPGEWTRQQLLGATGVTLGPERVHVVGWPRLDVLLERQAAYRAGDVPRDQRRTRVLWAPTHDFRKRGPEQRSTSSYPEFEQHLPRLEEHFDVRVSLHPRNRKDKRPTGDDLLWADCVVSDFGTMVYEAWALGKPVVFPTWIMGDLIVEHLAGSAEAWIFSQRIGHHADSIDELVAVLRADPQVEGDVRAFLGGYLDPASLGDSGRRAAAVLDDVRHGRLPW